MKRSKLQNMKLVAYKARKVALSDMDSLVEGGQECLTEILNINPAELFLFS